MVPLDPRKVRILQAIVNDYVQTAKPVASERLIEVCQLGCKSATVSNEMAEMVDRGYLLQPHTSAGRIPTDRGYRFYVDELMDAPSALEPAEREHAHAESMQRQSEIEDILVQTCRVLTSLSSYTSIATDPTTEAAGFRHVFLSTASPRHILLVALLSTGHVEHRLIEVDAPVTDSTLIRLSNFVNEQVAGKELGEAERICSAIEPPDELLSEGRLIGRIANHLVQLCASLAEQRVYLEGAHQLMRQQEFQDVQRLEALLSALESRSALYQAFRQALPHCSVSVLIGAENGYPAMQGCSLIATTYRIGDRSAGYLGVVGPTRMNYDRAVAAVSLMAESLSVVLTNLAVA